MEIRRSRDHDLTVFSVRDDGGRVAELKYYPTLTPNGYKINTIYVPESNRRLEIASVLGKAFVDTIGPDQPVCADVINNSTLHYLDERGFLALASKLGELDIVGPTILSKIPFVRAASIIGIRTDSVFIEMPFPLDNAPLNPLDIGEYLDHSRRMNFFLDFYVRLKGVTKPK
ncbi:hypothetical protein A3J13_02250 [Candidatus Daviesbacteria bacterium RIFCSPLOWO2_02_FULL_36_8]|uniref:Uncharacterized protein n=1 Tax=Candidatus Daviesbacteria bacterium RIFCSPLOWO2_02_FULL_36_8 TaxID=1797793 RepID=A0A1F5MHC1_9BACT|nr:MAG: hypothetical protein A3J13_02250 [Candidatus Daviesbacteria bacterium RIFCSPLOWO2_02_FULL_36_8]